MSWRDLDNLKKLSSSEFQLNPDAYCPLTIMASSIVPVQKIQSLFLSDKTSAPNIISGLHKIFQSEKIKVKELDEEGYISEIEIRKALSLSGQLSRAELFFFIYASYFYKRQTIARAEEAFKWGAIEGVKYSKGTCSFPECQDRHGNIYSIKEALKIKFRPGCKCDLSAYNSHWEKKEV